MKTKAVSVVFSLWHCVLHCPLISSTAQQHINSHHTCDIMWKGHRSTAKPLAQHRLQLIHPPWPSSHLEHTAACYLQLCLHQAFFKLPLGVVACLHKCVLLSEHQPVLLTHAVLSVCIPDTWIEPQTSCFHARMCISVHNSPCRLDVKPSLVQTTQQVGAQSLWGDRP